MSGKGKRKLGGLLFYILLLVFLNSGVIETVVSAFGGSSGSQIEYDYNMDTERYQVNVEVKEDCSYLVTEQIDVSFNNYRHGIYRYIPVAGSSVYENAEGSTEKIPYYADVENMKANKTSSYSMENGNVVFRLGDADTTVVGPQTYLIQYQFEPMFQQKDYTCLYYNIFPMQWQNDIPAGSTFTISLPKKIEEEDIRFYYGSYGETRDGSDILDWKLEGDVISGTLTEPLEMGTGLTIFANAGEGYFTSVSQASGWLPGTVGLSVAVLIIGLVLFWLFGRDEPIIPSIQYQPPENLDSAAVGYIIDGDVENRDIISLLIYWADKGYLRIDEVNEKISFEKLRNLPDEAPAYQRIVFDKLFKKWDRVAVSSLKYTFAETIALAKQAVKDTFYGEKGLYTGASRAARVAALLLCGLPFAAFVYELTRYSYYSSARMIINIFLVILLYAGTFVFCRGVDSWYGKSAGSRKATVAAGIGISMASVIVFAATYLYWVMQKEVFSYIPSLLIMVVVTGVMVVITGFMKKRTHQCVEWMGRLAGLRDFIETAELDRMKAMAEENPQWFYHVLPYAYVFGLSDVFARKLQEITIPAPDWYRSDRNYYGNSGYFNYYLWHRSMMAQMNQTSKVLTTPEPPKSSGSSGGSSFSGGSFGGGGGGFSGGGFGGGGGGSW